MHGGYIAVHSHQVLHPVRIYVIILCTNKPNWQKFPSLILFLLQGAVHLKINVKVVYLWHLFSSLVQSICSPIATILTIVDSYLMTKIGSLQAWLAFVLDDHEQFLCKTWRKLFGIFLPSIYLRLWTSSQDSNSKNGLRDHFVRLCKVTIDLQRRPLGWKPVANSNRTMTGHFYSR